MNEPIRYRVEGAKMNPDLASVCITFVRDETGDLVKYADYARLKAEVERLTKAHSDALADFWNIHKGYFDLKAEVEQLRKQGKQP